MADLEKLARAAEARLAAGDRAGGLGTVRELAAALEALPEPARRAWNARLGALYLAARRFGQAEEMLRAALSDSDPDPLLRTLQLRRALQGQGRFAEAAEVATRYLTYAQAADPARILQAVEGGAEDPEAGMLAPDVAVVMGRLARLAAAPPPEAEAAATLADLLERVRGQPEQWADPVHALALASRLLQDSSRLPLESLAAWMALARTPLEARRDLPLVAYMAGQLAWVEGSLRARRGEVEAACAALEAADRLLPEDQGIRADKTSQLMLALQLADCLLEAERDGDAEHLYRHALREVDGESRPVVIFQAHHGLGRLCYRQERLAEAYRHMRRALAHFDYAEPPWIGRATPAMEGAEDYQLLRAQREEILEVLEDCRRRLPEEIARAFEAPGRSFKPGAEP